MKRHIIYNESKQANNYRSMTYFPKAKHSNVTFWPTKAVVSGNLTLRSAGYFLMGPEEKHQHSR